MAKIKFPDYDEIIDRHAAKYGVDPDLIRAIIQQESQGNAKAKSKKGALGLMQLMPKMALKYYHLNEDDLLDPEKNIKAGVSHFSDMLKYYKGDTTKAIAAYNAGQGPVNAANGVPNIDETKGYVKNVTGYYQGTLEPPKFKSKPVAAKKATMPQQTEGKQAGGKIDADAAAQFLESDEYRKMPKKQQDEIVDYLRKNLRPSLPPIPNPSIDVMRRRQEVPSIVGSTTPAQEFSKGALGEEAHGFAGGMGTGVHGLASLPSTLKHAATDEPTEAEKARAKRHPMLFATPERGAGLTLDRLVFNPQFSEFNKARTAAKEKRFSEAGGHGLASVVPGVGPMAAYFGEKIGHGEGMEALGEAGVYALADAAVKGLTHVAKPSQRLAAAAGGGARGFADTIEEINKTARKVGTPKTVGELEDVVKKSSTDLESTFNIDLQDVTSKFPAATSQRMPTEVANELLKKANEPHLLKTAEGRATRQYLRKRALEYMKPWKLTELNRQRMDLFNQRLASKSVVGQMQAMRSSAEVMADKIIEDNLKEIVYGDMDSLTGKTGKYRALKQKQSKMLDLLDRLHKRVDELADAQAEYVASPLVKKIGMSVSAHAGGMTPRAHGLMSLVAGGPEKVASSQVERAFPPTLSKAPGRATRYAVRKIVRNYPLAALYEGTKEPQKEPEKELTPLK